MKLHEIGDAARLYEKRRDLSRQYDAVYESVGHPGPLAVAIHGCYQDAAMVAAVRQAVLAELQYRTWQVDDELRALGVDVDASPEAA